MLFIVVALSHIWDPLHRVGAIVAIMGFHWLFILAEGSSLIADHNVIGTARGVSIMRWNSHPAGLKKEQARLMIKITLSPETHSG